MARKRTALLDTLKQIQKLKKAQVQAQKIAVKAEKAGLNVERLKEDFGLTKPIEVKATSENGGSGGPTIAEAYATIMRTATDPFQTWWNIRYFHTSNPRYEIYKRL